MPDAVPTFGTTLKLGPTGGARTALSKVVTITPPKISRNAVDSTHHGSEAGAMEFIPDGIHNPGQLTATMNYIAGDADDDLLLAAVLGGLYDFEFTANAATGTETFIRSGVMTEYGPDELPVSGKQTATFAIQLSGTGTQAPT